MIYAHWSKGWFTMRLLMLAGLLISAIAGGIAVLIAAFLPFH